MKNENNFEVKNIDLKEIDQIAEIKDEELKQVSGGFYTTTNADSGPFYNPCIHAH